MVAKPVPLTRERLARYNHDIISFMEDQYILPETRKLIVLEAWQKELILRPLFYDLNPDGTRKYNLALVGMPKKNGKSSLAAGIGLWFCFAGEPHGEVIVAANNLDQASLIIYDKIREAFRLNPQMAAAAKLLKDRIEMRSTGTVCRPIAHKYQTAAGVNPTLVLFDELWGFPGREFFDELTTSPSRREPLGLVVTYAGYDRDSLLYRLYEAGKKGKDPQMFYLWLERNMASWVTQKYLDSQRSRMPPNVYARFHENRWSSAEGGLVTEEDIERLHSMPWAPQYARGADDSFRYIMSCDLGLSHDRTARCVGHLNPKDGRVYVDNLYWWEGTKKVHVDMKAIEQDLIDTMRAFGVYKFTADPWQMEYIIQRLKPFYSIVPFNFNTDMLHLSQTLVTMLHNGKLVMYNCPELDKELREAISKQTQQGWRIDHARDKRNDLVVAVGMMAVEAIRGSFGLGEIPGDDEFKTPAMVSELLSKEF